MLVGLFPDCTFCSYPEYISNFKRDSGLWTWNEVIISGIIIKQGANINLKMRNIKIKQSNIKCITKQKKQYTMPFSKDTLRRKHKRVILSKLYQHYKLLKCTPRHFPVKLMASAMSSAIIKLFSNFISQVISYLHISYDILCPKMCVSWAIQTSQKNWGFVKSCRLTSFMANYE